MVGRVIAYVIAVQSYAGSRAEDLLLGRAPAQAHDGASVLLAHGALWIKNVADIVDAHHICYINQAGLGVDLHLHEVSLPGHEIQPLIRFPF